MQYGKRRFSMNWQEMAERTYERSQIPVEGKEHNPHLMGNIVWGALAAFTKVCFRSSGAGMENIRQFHDGKGAVIVCDHVSYFDPVFQYCILRPAQWPRFMAKSDVMHGFAAWFLGMHGAFPVERDSADLSAIKRAVRYLKDGEIVALFPEGEGGAMAAMSLRMVSIHLIIVFSLLVSRSTSSKRS
jgi:1-acyl-sn-glycerol-3-phosphate acyltransferase